MPVLNDRELREMQTDLDQRFEENPIMIGVLQRLLTPRLSVFWTEGHVWEYHNNPDGSRCLSRTMLLSYEWKGEQVYTPFYICIDCDRVGVHRSREQYAKREEPCEIRPSNGGCITHSLTTGECARYGLGPKKASPFKVREA